MNNSNMYDVIIVGGGPAGLTSAIYLGRAKYKVLVIEKETFGGQITITDEIVNYPGVLKSSGKELTSKMRKQAQNFNAEFLNAEVISFELEVNIKKVKTTRGDFESFGVILAMGASPRKIGFKNELEFQGKGVAYCATCDGEFFTDKEIFVIGGGYAAAEESVFLTKYGKHVTVLVRGDDFSCAKEVSDHTKNNEKISILYNTSIVGVSGDSYVNEITYKDLLTNKEINYKVDDKIGVFVFAGYKPATSLIKDKILLNENGYIICDKNQKTNIDGVYAAGDICEKKLRQVVTAVGDGAVAATELEQFCSKLHAITGIKPQILNKKEEIKNTQSNNTDDIFSNEMISQLNAVFLRMENELVLKYSTNDTKESDELVYYLNKLSSLTNKIKLIEEVNNDEYLPCVKVYKDNKYTGLAFHGVPGGHEFTSFILGLYNVSSKGQEISIDLYNKIKNINKKVDIKIFVTLSCTMCPDLVVSAQKIASLNELVTSEIYELVLYQDIKEKYNISSVPCFLINDKLYFGKKDIKSLLDLIYEEIK